MDEEGSTIIEVIVSAALLVGVLVPTASFLASNLSEVFVGDKIQAGIRAEQSMEEAIANPFIQDTTLIQPNSRYVIMRRTTRDSGFARISVAITRKTDSLTIANFATVRRLHDLDEVTQ